MTTVMTYASLQSDIQIYLDRNDATLVSMIPEFVTLAELRCAREVKQLGTKVCVVSVFSPTSWAYLKPNRWLQTISINFGNQPAFTSTFRQSASGTRTITLSAAHNFTVGSTISVYNIGDSTYNGTGMVVTAITQYTVTYVTGSLTESIVADTAGIICAPPNARTNLLPRSVEYCNAFWPDRTVTGTPRFYADYDYNNFLIVPTPQIAYPYEILMYAQPEFLSNTNTTNWWTMYARDLLLYACLLETAPYLKNDQRIPVWQDRYDKAAMAIKGTDKNRVNDATLIRTEQNSD